MASAVHDHFMAVFGVSDSLDRVVDFEQLGISQADLSHLEQPLTKEETWAAI